MDGEIDKAKKKLEKTNQAMGKQRKIISDPGYKTKVAAETQEADKKKLDDLDSEAKHLEDTIAQFGQLKLE